MPAVQLRTGNSDRMGGMWIACCFGYVRWLNAEMDDPGWQTLFVSTYYRDRYDTMDTCVAST
jgi:hypothetical protein